MLNHRKKKAQMEARSSPLLQQPPPPPKPERRREQPLAAEKNRTGEWARQPRESGPPNHSLTFLKWNGPWTSSPLEDLQITVMVLVKSYYVWHLSVCVILIAPLTRVFSTEFDIGRGVERVMRRQGRLKNIKWATDKLSRCQARTPPPPPEITCNERINLSFFNQ